MTISRRSVVGGGLAAGAWLLARPGDTLAAPLGPADAYGTSRVSRLFPGTRLVHADLHNHSLYSDGDGDPALAYASMKGNGLDVAALTDHATFSKLLPGSPCAALPGQPGGACGSFGGVDEAKWDITEGFADGANADGTFTALRGFEWSSPTLGHINVWFSKTWTDPVATGGANPADGAGGFAHEIGPDASDPVFKALDALVKATPSGTVGMAGFYEWLKADPDRPAIRGGVDALAGFNHPGREAGRFGRFAYDAAIASRVVTIEMFNRREDYLFEGTDNQGRVSPLVECLDAGWRVGIAGVTDEHDSNWGMPDGKGRTGLWVDSLTRAGVRAAMEGRRAFATRLKGLRVDASANGARMGSSVAHRIGPLAFQLDISRGAMWEGKPLLVQVLQTGDPLPSVVHTEEVVVPRDDQPVIGFTAPVDLADGRWVVLRVTDPATTPDSRAPAGPYKAAGGAVAYTSPFFLQEGVAAVVPEVPLPLALPLAAVGAGLLALRRRRAHDHDDHDDHEEHR